MNFSPVGILGFGLMGQGIATCLLASGHSIRVYDPDPTAYRRGRKRIDSGLAELVRRRHVKSALRKHWNKRVEVLASFDDFRACTLVIESVPENLDLKHQLFRELETVIAPRTVIASNTSSLPISVLQSVLAYPARFVGMHWGVPAEIMNFLEIIPGRKTARRTVTLARDFGLACGKDPTVLKEDIRGFIGNRMMYAMMREACYLVEAGIADIEMVDRAFRHDLGWWSTLAGPFRWMDLTGIPAYAAVMEGLFPTLSNQKAVPNLLRDVIAKGKEGISNGKGFYRYDKSSAARWRKAWVEFTYEIKTHSDKYDKLNRNS